MIRNTTIAMTAIIIRLVIVVMQIKTSFKSSNTRMATINRAIVIAKALVGEIAKARWQ